MEFRIKNLGKIKQANIEVNDLTIICGPNSSNKTWLSYFINHILSSVNQSVSDIVMTMDSSLNDEIENLLDLGSGSIDLNNHKDIFQQAFELSAKTTLDKLPSYFNLGSEVFEETQIDLCEHVAINENKYSRVDGRRVKLEKPLHSSVVNIDVIPDSEGKIVYSNGKGFNIIRHLLKREIYSHITRVLLSDSIFRPFVITSERTGCMVFQPEIDRTTIKAKEAFSELSEIADLESLPSEFIDTLEELSQGEHYTYANPVKHNVNIVRDASIYMRHSSFIKDAHPEVLEAIDKVNGGTFSYANSQLMFTTEDESNTLPVSISSSSVKSLFLLDLYIKSIAGPNDLLLIDEPELNLHPDNQRLMARVIARLVNTGVKVLITTHSDYLIREINNSIMLSNVFNDREEIMKSNDIIEEDILKPSQVSAYMVDEKGVVSEMAVGKLGINTQIFDCIINSANQLQSEIYFNLDDIDE
ncbi:hypothetical protein ACS85_16800 [Vibrio parahaemolyticus]|uniref:AAA family ATPase n=1 Tax=Vibrio parahaemolyticus TaxID=670 RepID=UPI0006A706B4|nr:AAA family ATPase [Vibrio parahaemolyticus]EIZ1365772.1 AAA family ATPase [Vibrio parahaemolyticus]EKO5222553.1 AAA family ATPase [Vibrio parahaemolyticus]ELX7525067.1 AAA family ATPase [Vibrio parahaemolyticus]KOE10417.1 hypothetical protein ACS85_16800 [Vibrio parahaemolyticus]